MKRTAIRALMIGAVAFGASAACAAAGPDQNQQTEKTPKGWSYNIQNGQRVAKGTRRETGHDGFPLTQVSCLYTSSGVPQCCGVAHNSGAIFAEPPESAVPVTSCRQQGRI